MKEVTGVQLAEVMNVSKEAVYQATRKGRIHRLPNGKYDLDQAQVDWKRNTRARWGGKRTPRGHQELENPLHDERVSNPPEVNFWLKVVEQSYPLMADEFGRHWKIQPAKAWKLLGTVFFLESCAAIKILGYPEDTSLDEMFEHKGPTNKLLQWPWSPGLELLPVNELRKVEGKERAPADWN